MKIRLKEARKQRKLTLRELAKLTGISKTELNDIENGKVIPRLDIYCKICKVLKITCNCELCDCDNNNSDYYI